jgi:hypothetical protein
VARVFNGTTDVITAVGANVASMNSAFSVAAWIKCAGTLTNVVYYGEGNTGTGDPMLQLQVNSGKWRMFLRRDGNASTSDVNGTPVSTSIVADNTWHHVVYAQDGAGAWQVYVDGPADATALGTYATQVMTPDNATVGALKRTGVGSFWTGTASEVATWTRQLSAAEAAALAGGMYASRLAPTHYWPLLGIASPETDIGTGSTVNGVLTGTTSAAGPNQVSYATFFPSLASRRPVPMIKGPDKDKLLSMRGNSF